MLWIILIMAGAFGFIAMQHDKRIHLIAQELHEARQKIAELERRVSNLDA